jgi:hypothetical protein
VIFVKDAKISLLSQFFLGVNMNREIVGKLFPDYLKLVDSGKCPFCKKKVNFEDFDDELSRKEFTISGLCCSCQKEMFDK